MTTPRHGADTVRQGPGAGDNSPPGGVRVLARRYHLIAPLGRGTMGVVWEAYDLAVHRKVAVKEVVLPPDMSQHDREVSRERAQREARAISQLAHPNVIAFYDLVEEHGHPWVVMELVNSRSLADQIRSDGPMQQQRIATLALAVLGALEAAHRAGITHRDVKPSNILLTDDGRVKLTDFGIARTAGDSPITGAGMLVGSPSYIPPEVIQGGEAGPPADMWGLGATLYAAVEARAPFDAGDPMATLHAVVSDPTPSTNRAGPLAPVIDGLLRKDPRRRLDTVKARHLLLDALRAFDRERASTPPPPPAPATPLPPVDAVVDSPVELPINGFPDMPVNGATVNGALPPANGLTPLPGAVPVADFDASSPYDFRYQEGSEYGGEYGSGYDSDQPADRPGGVGEVEPPVDFGADPDASPDAGPGASGGARPGVDLGADSDAGLRADPAHGQPTFNGTGPVNGVPPAIGLNGTGPINGTAAHGTPVNGTPVNGSPTNGYVNGTVNGTTLGRSFGIGSDDPADSHSTDSHSTDSHSSDNHATDSRPDADSGFDFGAAAPVADFDFGPPAADFDAPPYPAAARADQSATDQSATDRSEPGQTAAAPTAGATPAAASVDQGDAPADSDRPNDEPDYDTAVIPRVPSNEPGPAVAGAMPIARPASGRQAHPLAHLQGFDPATGDGFDDMDDDFGTEPWRTQAVFEPARPNPYPLNPPAAPEQGRRTGAAEGGLAALDLAGSSSGTRQIPALLDDPPRRGPTSKNGRSTEKGRSGGKTAGVLIALVALCIAGYGGYWLTQHVTGGSDHPAAASPTSVDNSASGTAPTRNKPSRSQPANTRTGGYTPYRGASFTAAIPNGWKSDPQGTGVLDFNAPSNDRFIRFVNNVESSGDLVGGFKAAEQQFTGEHQDYHQIAIHQVSYRGYPAADWEFTYAKDGGTRHVLYRSFTVNSKTYGIYISAPEPLYQATLPVFNEAAKTFAAR